MPLLKQARKKMRHDRKRTLQNKDKKIALKKLVKTMRKTPSAPNLTAAFSKLDKAVKTNLIHKNKANRLKSRLAKTLAKPAAASTAKK
jgi:small subunit ribosomal protein S20